MSLSEIFRKYEILLMGTLELPDMQHGVVSKDGKPTRLFFAFLSSKKTILLDFLRDTGLIPKAMTCERCGCEMSLQKYGSSSDGVRWYCGKKRNNQVCYASKSVRSLSWFSHSKLTLAEILLLTYDIIMRVPSSQVREEYGFSSSTMADWNQFIHEVLVEYVETENERIGGPGKTVEINESKFGKRKHNSSHHLEGQCVFAAIERDTGRSFFVVVEDRTAKNLVTVIEQWILPGTTVISDYQKTYKDIEDVGFEHLTSNQGLTFMDSETWPHTHTIDSSGQYIKSTLPTYTHGVNSANYLAEYIFHNRCACLKESPVTKFFEIVRQVRW